VELGVDDATGSRSTSSRAGQAGAFVTGGARGIGRAIVAELARTGRRVVLADRDGADDTAEALCHEGLDVHPVTLDVTDVDALQDAVAEADAVAPLDVLVNNAGIGFAEPITSMRPEQFDRLMAVNLRAVFFAVQAAARVMVPRGRGAIVNLASTSAFTASTSPMVAYDTSKGAVRMLTTSAARELAPSGVRVNAVAPGTIDTDLTRSLASEPGDLDRLAQARIPLGHLGQPDDIARAVVWLAGTSRATPWWWTGGG
jgi:NAD(P)-dependent dehydrogenase (short-subunit alcohol dehydrogenase family)